MPPAKDATLRGLVPLMQTTEGFGPAAEALRAGRSAAVDGAWGSSAPLAVSALADRVAGAVLVAIAHPGDLDAWTADLESFTGHPPAVFAAFDTWSAERSRLD